MYKNRIRLTGLTVFLVSILSGTVLNAQTGIQASFVQTGTNNGKVVSGEGTIYYAAPTSLALRYSTPEGECFVIDGDRVYVNKAGKVKYFDAKKNAPMRTMSQTLLSCIEGDVDAVAQANEADVMSSETAKIRKITVTAKKKSVRGYETIELRYRKSDGMVEYIKLIEFNGNVNEYMISACKRDVQLPADAFTIPEKNKNGKS
ncbi:MAG: outer membrane lipoprotein carrier protein LolA [Candidatus Cryptobacteroides sp.]